ALHCLRNPLQRPRLRSCFRPRCRRGDLLHRDRHVPAPYRIYPVRGVLMTSALAPAPSKLAAERKKAAEPGQRLGSRTGNAIAGIAAWAIGILFVFPVFFMVLTSLHSEPNASTNPPSFFPPLTLDGYREFLGPSSGASPWPPLINSAPASIISTILVILLAIPAAYALAVKPIKKVMG